MNDNDNNYKREWFENSIKSFFDKASRYDYTETMCKILKELKFKYETEGGYSRRVLICRIEDNIEMIMRHCTSYSKAEEYFHMCYPGITLFCRKMELTEEFIKKHNVKPWHIALMKRTYFDIELNCKDWSHTESDCEIRLGDKRPYGNSYILGDIAEEYFTYNKNKKVKQGGYTFKWDDEEIDSSDVDIDNLRDDYISDNQDFFWNIMDETNDIIRNGLKEIELSSMEFVITDSNTPFNYYTEKWEICELLQL